MKFFNSRDIIWQNKTYKGWIFQNSTTKNAVDDDDDLPVIIGAEVIACNDESPNQNEDKEGASKNQPSARNTWKQGCLYP